MLASEVSEADVAEVRHVVQRILVPCVFVIGLLGNSVSIYVLTRKRMRCTTNIYLTALAITDIIYLAMALLLSLKHYSYVQRHCEPYWMYYGIVVWLCDACAYISIYIAVCFTIERFIAIRYPLKRQTFCTESLAKKVIAGVTVFCLFSTISTAFEHQYTTATKLIDSHGGPCNQTLANGPDGTSLDFTAMWTGSGDGPEEEEKKDEQSEYTKRSNLVTAAKRNASMDVTTQRMLERLKESASNIPNIAAESFFLHNNGFLVDGGGDGDGIAAPVSYNMQMAEKYAENDSVIFNVTKYCQNVTYYQNSYSSLAKNELYTRIWYFFTLFVFVLIPLCVLGTFNCFLIMLVRRSKSLRGEMTNASSIRRPKRKSNLSSVSQENRVTVTLIAVVLLFIVCQLPWAIYLIVSEHMEIEMKLQAIIGNIFNFLAAINAAANFFLYCVLSDKYRKTVRELITGYKYRGGQRHYTHANTSLYANTATSTNGSRRFQRQSAIK